MYDLRFTVLKGYVKSIKSPVATICTTCYNIWKLYVVLHSAFMYFVRFSQQTPIFFLNRINQVVFLIHMVFILFELKMRLYIYKIQINFNLQRVNYILNSVFVKIFS